jgi:hypothetical protein
MKALAHALMHKSVRSSAGTGLRASGAAPVSGSTASDNLEGASMASAEVLEGMDSAFRDIVIGGMLTCFKCSFAQLTGLQMTSEAC